MTIFTCNTLFYMLNGNSSLTNKAVRKWINFFLNGINKTEIKGKTLQKWPELLMENFFNKINHIVKWKIVNLSTTPIYKKQKNKKCIRNLLKNPLSFFKIFKILA